MSDESALKLAKRIFSVALALVTTRGLSAACSLIVLWITPLHALPQVGFYLASLNILAVGVFGRFELLVLNAKNDGECSDATYLCAITALVAGASVAGIAPFISSSTPTLSFLFVFGLLARAWLRLGLIFAIRAGAYDKAVVSMLPHAVAQPVVLLLLTWWSWDPLSAFASADLVGHVIAAGCVCHNQRASFRRAFAGKFTAERVYRLACSNFDLPTLNASSVVSAALFGMAPWAFLASLPNSILVGSLAAAFRLVELPMSVVSGAVTPILLREFAQQDVRYPDNRTRALYFLPLGLATAACAIVCGAGLFASHLGIARHWQEALALLPFAALFQLGIAAAAPLVEASALAGYRNGMLGANLASVALAAIALLVWGRNPVLAILMAGLVGMLRAGTISFWMLSRNQRTPVSQAAPSA